MKALLALAIIASTSCALSVSPDGSREYRADPNLIAQMIERFTNSQPSK